MNERESGKCSKCGSSSLRKKSVRLSGSAGFWNTVGTTAYICNECGYIELYSK